MTPHRVKTSVDSYMSAVRPLDFLRQNSLPTLVQEELERMLRVGDFIAGAPLRESALAVRLGVSRGPIREAFRSLEEKGLVRVEKNRGVFVRTITPEEADDIFEVRSALEELIVSRIAKSPERLAESGLPQLLERAQQMAAVADFAGCHAANVEFHQRLAELSGNPSLLQTYQRLVNELSLFRQQAHASTPDASTLRQSVAEHQELYAALSVGNRRRALKVLKEHVEASRKRLRKLLSHPTGSSP